MVKQSVIFQKKTGGARLQVFKKTGGGGARAPPQAPMDGTPMVPPSHGAGSPLGAANTAPGQTLN